MYYLALPCKFSPSKEWQYTFLVVQYRAILLSLVVWYLVCLVLFCPIFFCLVFANLLPSFTLQFSSKQRMTAYRPYCPIQNHRSFNVVTWYLVCLVLFFSCLLCSGPGFCCCLFVVCHPPLPPWNLPHHVLSCLILSLLCLILARLLSGTVLSCPVLSCPALSLVSVCLVV